MQQSSAPPFAAAATCADFRFFQTAVTPAPTDEVASLRSRLAVADGQLSRLRADFATLLKIAAALASRASIE